MPTLNCARDCDVVDSAVGKKFCPVQKYSRRTFIVGGRREKQLREKWKEMQKGGERDEEEIQGSCEGTMEGNCTRVV